MVLVEKDGHIDFNLSNNNEDIKLRIEFEDDEEESSIENRDRRFIGKSDTEATMVFKNYNAASGVFTLDPVYVGTIGGEDLYWSYNIVHLKNAGKQFFYTFSIDEGQ